MELCPLGGWPVAMPGTCAPGGGVPYFDTPVRCSVGRGVFDVGRGRREHIRERSAGPLREYCQP